VKNDSNTCHDETSAAPVGCEVADTVQELTAAKAQAGSMSNGQIILLVIVLGVLALAVAGCAPHHNWIERGF